MSRGRRGTIAGFALAAAGTLVSRLGRRPAPVERAPEDVSEPHTAPEAASTEAVERARTELADELARRAKSS